MPLCRVAPSCHRKKATKPLLHPKRWEKGQTACPQEAERQERAQPGAGGGARLLPLCLPKPREPRPPRFHHRHGAVCQGSPESRAGQTQR